MGNWDDLKHNSTIEFTKKPVGSWVKEGEKYHVTKGKNLVHYRNKETGGATYDDKHVYDKSLGDRQPQWKEHELPHWGKGEGNPKGDVK